MVESLEWERPARNEYISIFFNILISEERERESSCPNLKFKMRNFDSLECC